MNTVRLDSAHEKAILEAWLQEHIGCTIETKSYGFVIHLANSSNMTFNTCDKYHWSHISHYGKTVTTGTGLLTFINYLDSLNMPKAEDDHGNSNAR